EIMSSGNAGLDTLLGGGIDRASSVLLMGPSGIGKSTVAISALVTAALRGEKSAVYSFDESINTLVARCAGLGINLEECVRTGALRLQKIDPAEFTPGQFSNLLMKDVQQDGVSAILIDGLNGYLNAMQRSDFLMLHLHEMLSALNSCLATVFLV